jgi:hypothetical protein
MQLIEQHTITSAQIIDIINIPDIYTDLVLMLSVRGSSSFFLGLGLNGSVSSFSNRQLTGDGSSASSVSRSDTYIGPFTGSADTANTFASVQVYLPNYAANQNKSFSVDMVGENNATTAYQTLTAGLWSSTSAITSIQIYQWGSGNAKQNLAANSSFSLYGVLAGSDGIVSVS